MAQTSPRFGVSDEKVSAVWDFEHSDLFSEAERAALRVALGAGHSPSEVTAEDFAALKCWYTTQQIVQFMSVICLFGFLNRWNDTLATELEPQPLAYAGKVVGSARWNAGKHAPMTIPVAAVSDPPHGSEK